MSKTYYHIPITLLYLFIIQWEGKVEKSKEEFEQISKTIKEEVKRFDLVRANEFRAELTKYVEKMYQNQENVTDFIDSLIHFIFNRLILYTFF